MFQPREGGPAIEEADGHDDEAQPVAVEEGLKDEKSSGDFPEEEVKPPGSEEDAKSARSQNACVLSYPRQNVDHSVLYRFSCSIAQNDGAAKRKFHPC